MLYRIKLTVLFLVLFELFSSAETKTYVPVGDVASYLPAIVSDSVYVNGVRKFHRSVLHFRWSESNFEKSFLDNESAARMLVDVLNQSDSSEIDSVTVVAYASPEGAYEYNMKLSRERAGQFSKIFFSQFDNHNIKVIVRAGGEAWDLLRERLNNDKDLTDVARDRFFRILDDPKLSLNTKKWRFMHGWLGDTAHEGDVYHYLLVNHYCYLRCMEITIHYKEHLIGTSRVEESESEPESEPEPEPEPEHEPIFDLEPTPAPKPFVAPYQPVFGLSTNLIYDAAYVPGYGMTSIPSFSLEYYPARGRFTFGVDVEWPMWRHPQEHRYFQINNVTLWARRYFKPSSPLYKGFFLLANVNATQYGIGFNADKGWEGEGVGLSLGGGYKFYLGKRIYMEVGAAFGTFYSWYDPYVWGNDATGRYYYDYSGTPSEFSPRRMRLVWVGPTRAFFSIGLDLFNRNKSRR